MVGYIKGRVTHIFADFCFVEANGIGWRVFISEMTRKNLCIGEETLLFTHLNVREDAMYLYGFSNREDYETFLILLSVSGIGPKVAMGILSSITTAKLALAVQNKEIATLTKLPGIGKKSAERILVELKGKLSVISGLEEEDFSNEDLSFGDTNSEAVAALMSLGYTVAEISPVIKKVGNLTNTEELIKFALRELGRR